ncbi:MAG: SDR family oxidoreductase [Rothia sp. (in: high G+C Gram-positive bacteria)]|uniref:NAD(P)-binding oxidoreductase n=1 Tax=Rothia sp. (in: high G+C Gram-positive bacteria) TaxID=1885016 RepID=UPI0026E0612F|nr:NAD(P)-binding oxidoreductase [Rothia sp. (in: high G+C Gram-positive bacteria)]MDO5749834.1 SDR family oxidoreductase [Rothia sp. (in: high G+C Gram-positive bacteria)]
MNILICGATGRTGQLVTTLALESGHHVTAYVRNELKARAVLPEHSNLRIIRGELEDIPALTRAARGAHAAISTLGQDSLLKNMLRTDFMRRNLPPIVQAVSAAGVPRLVLLSSIGSGASYDSAPLAIKLARHSVMRAIIGDKNAADTLLESGDTQLSYVYAGMLTNSPSSLTPDLLAVHPGQKHLKIAPVPFIPREQVARALLKCATSSDENEANQHWVVRAARG